MTDAYDVNAARESRNGAEGRVWQFRVDGQSYTFPRELSREQARALRTLHDTDTDGLLAILLGAKQYERFDRHDLTLTDIAALLEAYDKATGLGDFS